MPKLFIIVLAAVLFGRTAEAQNSYSTNFALTENPISEGGRWINGGTTGLDWKNCKTTSGLAGGTGVSASPPYDDPTCVLTGSWGRSQTATATVQVAANPSGFQEVELRLLTTITAHRIVGYEVLFSVTSNNYVDIVRWNGPVGQSLNDFTFIVQGAHPSRPLRTGDRIKATVDASGLISAYADLGSGWVLVASGTDTTYTSGSPGMGFFANGGGAITGFGLTAYSASDDGTAPPGPPAPPTSLKIVSKAQTGTALSALNTTTEASACPFLRLSFAFARNGRPLVAPPAPSA